MPEMRLLLEDIDVPDIEHIDAYCRCGGYAAMEKVLREATPAEVIEQVSAAGLCDRGGRWFPIAERWRQVPAGGILCVEANESEPGTFRDRKLIERHPHQLLEGILVAAYAIGAREAYIYIRCEMARGRQLLQEAVDQAYARGWLGDDIGGTGFGLEVRVHPGAGAYIAGEETALLNSLAGGRAEPRPQPPTTWEQGIWGGPALVENAGTLAYLPHILRRGADGFRAMGTERYPGTLVFCVSGHVRRPGLYELELGGATLRELIYDYAGGPREGHQLKAVIPGGGGSPVLRPDELDVRLSPEDWAVPGGGDFPGAFGTGGVIAMDETTCMVEAALNLIEFYADQSCGQCPPCREGAPWLGEVLRRIEEGRGREGDMDLLQSIAAQVSPLLSDQRATLCSFGQRFAWPLQAFVRAFAEEFERHIHEERCPIAKDPAIKVPDTVSVRF
jgi:NADH-quinone oxidoreductase subunit F